MPAIARQHFHSRVPFHEPFDDRNGPNRRAWSQTDRSVIEPACADFWFVMSMALLTGFVVAYPINWWLVAKGLKHGMMTVRPRAAAETHGMTAATPIAGGAPAMPVDMGSPRGNDLKHQPPPSPA